MSDLTALAQKLARIHSSDDVFENDVLCCVCAPNVNVGKLVANATACLERISNG